MKNEIVNRALIFAIKAHEGIKRRGKEIPYIVHPMEAVSIVATISEDPELLAAAALHDVVEDTNYTIKDIEQEFGARVAKMVYEESDVVVENESEEQSWHFRKQNAIDRLKKASIETKIVALGDKLSNMRAIALDYDAIGDKLWTRFHVTDVLEHEWHYRGLAESLSELRNTRAYKEFVYLINIVFSSKEKKA